MNNNMLNMLNMIMQNGNPQAMVNNMLQNNPQINSLLRQQQQSGMTMEQFARQMAMQSGVNIEPMINMLRNRGIRL